ncbi:MAG: leucine-rich repeat domain-containing protein, partial [Ruminiclostridium sp.]|nr:leucine-rich repeat domain-containing protein [Ruminiclostridium sp.]
MKKIIAVLFFMTAALVFGCNVGAEAAEKNDVLQWGDWSYILVNNEAYVCSYNGTDREITIPSEIEGKRVTAICSRLEGSMFKRFFTAEEPQTVSVTVPEGVTELRRRCFGNCKILKQVTLPSTLERIGEDAFSYCPNLTEVNIPKSVKWIGDSAFKECGIS